MNNVININSRILPSSDKAIENVRKLQDIIINTEQAEIKTQHIIHGGMYSRTIKVPAGTLLTGALIKVGTILIMQGDVIVYAEDKATRFNGYYAFAASALRKQVFLAITDVYLTTVFPTSAKTIQEAEAEFTDEVNLLLSHKQTHNNTIIITGE